MLYYSALYCCIVHSHWWTHMVHSYDTQSHIVRTVLVGIRIFRMLRRQFSTTPVHMPDCEAAFQIGTRCPLFWPLTNQMDLKLKSGLCQHLLIPNYSEIRKLVDSNNLIFQVTVRRANLSTQVIFSDHKLIKWISNSEGKQTSQGDQVFENVVAWILDCR